MLSNPLCKSAPDKKSQHDRNMMHDRRHLSSQDLPFRGLERTVVVDDNDRDKSPHGRMTLIFTVFCEYYGIMTRARLNGQGNGFIG